MYFDTFRLTHVVKCIIHCIVMMDLATHQHMLIDTHCLLCKCVIGLIRPADAIFQWGNVAMTICIFMSGCCCLPAYW